MTAARPNSPRGTVLVLVLVVVGMLAMVTAGTLFLMRGELGTAAAAERAAHARAAAMSGIHRAMSALLDPPADGGGTSDNPGIFQAQKVSAEDGDTWYFSVYADNLADPSSPAFGVQDESARLNLNVATEEMLMALPGMTEPLVHCLLDYRDADRDTHAQGLEQDPAGEGGDYFVKNAPLSTPEELLMVKGFDGRIVYGEDANLNAALEPNEDDGDESHPPDDGDGTLNPGLRPLVTTFSYDPDLDSEGSPRININTENPNSLRGKLEAAGLGRETIDFIVLARQAGAKWPDPSALLEATMEVADPGSSGRGRGRGRGSGRGGGGRITISSGVSGDNLDVVTDKLTCAGGALPGGQTGLPGRVNVNAAPLAVLAALPGLDENTARRIVDARGQLDEQQRSNIAWLYSQNVVSADTYKKIAPLLTGRGYQFRVRSFGYSTVHGSFSVLEAVVDLASGQPRIVYLRDLTRLGMPMPVSLVER